ncbi:MAG: T9SS type A sorting domain-containing protein [bacterium]|nr:T9SS type A sorting domain-containing protein [bacterium]
MFSIYRNLLYTISPPELIHNTRFGFSISGGGNITGQNRKDLVIGQPYYQYHSQPNTVRIFIFEVSNSNEIHFSENTLPNISILTYPNPFNHTMTIPIQTPKPMKVELSLYDVEGNEIEMIYRGWINTKHILQYQEELLSSGVYFILLKMDKIHSVRKVLALR